MANEKNLKPNSERTPKERKENARKGGNASGKARLAKKTAREYAIAALEGVQRQRRKVYHIDKFILNYSNIISYCEHIIYSFL